jgi:hypothetical protein
MYRINTLQESSPQDKSLQEIITWISRKMLLKDSILYLTTYIIYQAIIKIFEKSWIIEITLITHKIAQV